MHVAYRIGRRHPATVGAAGMAILAGRPAQPAERIEITAGRQQGYVASEGEIQVGRLGFGRPGTARHEQRDRLHRRHRARHGRGNRDRALGHLRRRGDQPIAGRPRPLTPRGSPTHPRAAACDPRHDPITAIDGSSLPPPTFTLFAPKERITLVTHSLLMPARRGRRGVGRADAPVRRKPLSRRINDFPPRRHFHNHHPKRCHR